MFDVFLSHSTKDLSAVNTILEYLESNGIKCWIAPREITGGKIYAEEIVEGIQACPVFLLVLSEASILSKHVLSELDTAFNENRSIIPFCIDDAITSRAFSYYLRASQRVDGRPPLAGKLEDLKATIISNIPELAVERERKLAYSVLAKDLGWTEERLERFKRTVLKNVDDGVDDSSDLNESAGRSRYDVLVNDAGEILLIISKRKGEVGEEGALFVIDNISKYALLYRSHESSVFFDDIAKRANEAIRQVESILVVETTEDDVIREYSATVRIVKDVRVLMDEQEFHDEEDLYEFFEDVPIDGNTEENNEEEQIDNQKDVLIPYDAKTTIPVSADSVFVYQESGDNVLFLTNTFFVVPKRLSESEVSRLSRGKTAMAYNINDVPNKDLNMEEEDDSFPLFEVWLQKTDVKVENLTIPVKSMKVESVLQFLSGKWNERDTIMNN